MAMAMAMAMDLEDPTNKKEEKVKFPLEDAFVYTESRVPALLALAHFPPKHLENDVTIFNNEITVNMSN